MVENTSRREVIKKGGLVTTALLGLGSGNVTALACGCLDDNPNKSVNDNSKVEHQGEYVYSQSSALHYYGSYSPKDSDKWRHDLALSTAAASEYQDDYWMSGDAKEIKSTKYSLTVNDDSNESAVIVANPDYQGAYPKDGSDNVPQWVETTFDLAIGSLHPTVAFALTADDMYQALTPDDGFSWRDDGVDFYHSPGTYETLWTDTAHFNRFELEDRAGPDGTWDLEVTASTGTTEFATEPSVTFTVYCYEESFSAVTSSVSETSDVKKVSLSSAKTDRMPSTVDPDKMSARDRKAFGVQNVSDKNIKSPHGEEVEYIATNYPIKAAISSN